MKTEVRILKGTLEHLPLDIIEFDQKQPRKELRKPLNNDAEKDSIFSGDLRLLLESISKRGLLQPFTVNKIDKNAYTLIDGHRRYLCCEKLGLNNVCCLVYENLNKGESEYVRFTVQNHRKNWKPLEKADSIGRMQRIFETKTSQELAELTHLSKTSISSSLKLLDAGIPGIEVVSKYNLELSYCNEYISLRPKLRKIKNIQVTQMDDLLLGKVKNKIITKAKDFRKIRKVFLRAHTHQEELYDFLTNPDMTVDELCERAENTGFLFDIEKVLESIAGKLQENATYSEKELEAIKNLNNLTGNLISSQS